MAQAEVRLAYSSKARNAIFGVLLAFLPFLAIFTMWSLVVLLMVNPHSVMLLGATGVFLAEVAMMFAAVAGLIVVGDKTILLAREGLSVPFLLCPQWSARKEFSWTQLKAVQYHARGSLGRLILYFHGARPIGLSLGNFGQGDVERLLVALEVWGHASERFPQLEEVKGHLTTIESADGKTSYTQLWEEEMTRRFGATNFVPLEPGHVISSHSLTVERQLAFGGLSAIYLVMGGSQKRYVLKEAIIPHDPNSQEAMKALMNFRREAEFLFKLSHPQIAHVYDYFVDDGRHYLLMEYIPGTDLRQLVRERGRQPEERVITMAREIADILYYLHSQDVPIIHRDLTPENLILGTDGQVILIDFGAANHFVGTATGTMIGKQCYMAPEQLRGKATIASDIYALGATMHFLLTGEDPEPISVSHPHNIIPEITKEMDGLVALCTQLDGKGRPESAKAVGAFLATLTGSSPEELAEVAST